MDTSTRFASLMGAADACLTQFGIGSYGPLTGEDSFPKKKGKGHSAQGARPAPRNRSARQDHGGATPSPAYATSNEFGRGRRGDPKSVGDLINFADGVLARYEFDGYGDMPESLADYKRGKKRKDTAKGAVAGAAVGAGGVVAARRMYRNMPAGTKANLYLAKENAKDSGAAAARRVKEGVRSARTTAGYAAKDAGEAGKEAGKKVLKKIAGGVGKVRRRVGFEAGQDDAPAFVQFMQSQGDGSREESRTKKIAGTAALVGAGLLAGKSVRRHGGVKTAGKKLIGGTKEVAGRVTQRVTRPLRSRKMRKQATEDAIAGRTRMSSGGETLDLARVDRLLTNLDALTSRAR